MPSAGLGTLQATQCPPHSAEHMKVPAKLSASWVPSGWQEQTAWQGWDAPPRMCGGWEQPPLLPSQ